MSFVTKRTTFELPLTTKSHEILQGLVVMIDINDMFIDINGIYW